MALLKNLLRQTRVFNLERPAFVAAAGEHPAGKPESMTLWPMEAREVSEETLKCAEVASALSSLNGRATLRVL